MDMNDRTKVFSEYLKDAQIRITNKRHRMISGAQIAREAKVSQPSYNQWVSGARLPDGDNRFRIALYLWQQLKETTAYELLELPIPMPDEVLLRDVLTLLIDATPAEIELVKEFIRRNLNKD